jgi:hypothetical protein
VAVVCAAGTIQGFFKRLREHPYLANAPPQGSEGLVELPKFIKWWKWRLVIEKITTLKEIEQYWSLLDVYDANRIIDLKDEAEARLTRKR